MLLSAACGFPLAADPTPTPPDPTEAIRRAVTALAGVTSYRLEGGTTVDPATAARGASFTGEALLPDRQVADVTTSGAGQARVTVGAGLWTSTDGAGRVSSGAGVPPGPWPPQQVLATLEALAKTARMVGYDPLPGGRLLHLAATLDPAALGHLLPPPRTPLQAELWVSEADGLPRRLRVQWEALVPGQNRGQTMTTTYDLRLSDFNGPVAVP